jgi:hypothetical protein
MGICRKCMHLRKLIPASQLLAKAMGTADADISKALVKIQEDESEQRGSEAQTRARRDQLGEEAWGFKPMMSDYCGLHEEDDNFLIAEIKNLGGRCTDFAAGATQQRPCLTCAHRNVAGGASKDREREQSYNEMAMGNVSAGMATSTPDNLLSKHREGTASRRAFELSAVYASKGELLEVPAYLDRCAHYSTDDAYVVCVLRNPHGMCAGWAATAGAVAAPRPQAPAPAPAPQAAPPPPAPRAPMVRAALEKKPAPADPAYHEATIELCRRLADREMSDDELATIHAAVDGDYAAYQAGDEDAMACLDEIFELTTTAEDDWFTARMTPRLPAFRAYPWATAGFAVGLYDARASTAPEAIADDDPRRFTPEESDRMIEICEDFIALAETLMGRELGDETIDLRCAVDEDFQAGGDLRKVVLESLPEMIAQFMAAAQRLDRHDLLRTLAPIIAGWRPLPCASTRALVALWDANRLQAQADAEAAPPPPRRAPAPRRTEADGPDYESLEGASVDQMFDIRARNAEKTVAWLHRQIAAAEQAGKDSTNLQHKLQKAMNGAQRAMQLAQNFSQSNHETMMNSIKKIGS